MYGFPMYPFYGTIWLDEYDYYTSMTMRVCVYVGGCVDVSVGQVWLFMSVGVSVGGCVDVSVG